MLDAERLQLMVGAAEFFPPVQYSWQWPVLAAAIVVVVVGYFVAVPILTRERRSPEPTDLEWMPALDTVALRERYVGLISEVEVSHAEGGIDARSAHQRLSMLLRRFAFDASGIRAPQMTLADLREYRVTALGDAVEKLYPTAFAELENGSVAEASALASRMVREWK